MTRAGTKADSKPFGDFWLQPIKRLAGYDRQGFGADLAAGITVAAFAIPQGIAYAAIAELPPHFGLYTAAIGAMVGALWGSSNFLSTGPTNAISLLVLSVLIPIAAPGTSAYLLAAGVLAVLAGAFLCLLALLRLGALVTLASRSVMVVPPNVAGFRNRRQ